MDTYFQFGSETEELKIRPHPGLLPQEKEFSRAAHRGIGSVLAPDDLKRTIYQTAADIAPSPGAAGEASARETIHLPYTDFAPNGAAKGGRALLFPSPRRRLRLDSIWGAK